MGEFDKYMNGANDEQRKIFRELDDLTERKKRLKDLTHYGDNKRPEDYVNPNHYKYKRELKNVNGRIEKLERDAKSQGIIIINSNG